MVIRLFRRVIRRWLEERALVLPAARRKLIAQKFHVSEETVLLIESEIRKWVLEVLDLE